MEPCTCRRRHRCGGSTSSGPGQDHHPRPRLDHPPPDEMIIWGGPRWPSAYLSSSKRSWLCCVAFWTERSLSLSTGQSWEFQKLTNTPHDCLLPNKKYFNSPPVEHRYILSHFSPHQNIPWQTLHQIWRKKNWQFLGCLVIFRNFLLLRTRGLTLVACTLQACVNEWRGNVTNCQLVRV